MTFPINKIKPSSIFGRRFEGISVSDGVNLGAVQKLFVQNAQDEFVIARRRREACRGTLTDDNAAMADSDKHYV